LTISPLFAGANIKKISVNNEENGENEDKWIAI
jgi:hypothetical protein